MITNNIEACKEMRIDKEYVATHYTVGMVDGVTSFRKFSDHKAIMARMKLIPIEMKKINLPTKFIKTSE